MSRLSFLLYPCRNGTVSCYLLHFSKYVYSFQSLILTLSLIWTHHSELPWSREFPEVFGHTYNIRDCHSSND